MITLSLEGIVGIDENWKGTRIISGAEKKISNKDSQENKVKRMKKIMNGLEKTIREFLLSHTHNKGRGNMTLNEKLE